MLDISAPDLIACTLCFGHILYDPKKNAWKYVFTWLIIFWYKMEFEPRKNSTFWTFDCWMKQKKEKKSHFESVQFLLTKEKRQNLFLKKYYIRSIFIVQLHIRRERFFVLVFVPSIVSIFGEANSNYGTRSIAT